MRAALDAARERLKYEGAPRSSSWTRFIASTRLSRTPPPVPRRGPRGLRRGDDREPLLRVIAPLLSRSRSCGYSSLGGRPASLLDRGQQRSDGSLARARTYLLRLSGGDGRRLLNALEAAAAAASGGSRSRTSRGRWGEVPEVWPGEHYDVISAFIKSVRAETRTRRCTTCAHDRGGEDPVFIARRLVILASEDIGNADPHGLPLAMAAAQTVQLVGMPEGRIPLAQATTYLASAPKSNASYVGINKALDDVRRGSIPEVPMHLRNAPTGLMKDEGYGEGYRYAHDHGEAEGMNDRYLPDELAAHVYYEPKDRGAEDGIKKRLRIGGESASAERREGLQ